MLTNSGDRTRTGVSEWYGHKQNITNNIQNIKKHWESIFYVDQS